MQEANSDDEQYANDSFEQESDDVTIPEISETESELDVRPSTSQQKHKISNSIQQQQKHQSHRFSSRFMKNRHQQYKTSSDEDNYDEDDVIIGEAKAEINTMPMNMDTLETPEKFNTNVKSRQTTTTTPCVSRRSSQEKHLSIQNKSDTDDEELQDTNLQVKHQRSKEKHIKQQTKEDTIKEQQTNKLKIDDPPIEELSNASDNEDYEDDDNCDTNNETMQNLYELSNGQNYNKFLSNEEYMEMNAKFRSMIMTDEFKKMHDYNNFAQSTHREYHNDSENNKLNHKNGFYFDDDIPSMVSDIIITNNILQPTMDDEKLNDADEYEYEDGDENKSNLTLTEENNEIRFNNKNKINKSKNSDPFLTNSLKHHTKNASQIDKFDRSRQYLAVGKSGKPKKSRRTYLNEDPKTKVEEFNNSKYYDYDMDQTYASSCEIFEIDDNTDRYETMEADDNYQVAEFDDNNENEHYEGKRKYKFYNGQAQTEELDENDYEHFVEQSFNFGEDNEAYVYNGVKFNKIKINEATDNVKPGEKTKSPIDIEPVLTVKPLRTQDVAKNAKTSITRGGQENKKSNSTQIAENKNDVKIAAVKGPIAGNKNLIKQPTKLNEINNKKNNNNNKPIDKTIPFKIQEGEKCTKVVDNKISMAGKATIKQPLNKQIKEVVKNLKAQPNVGKTDQKSLMIKAAQVPSKIPIRAPIFKAANAKQLTKAAAEAKEAAKSNAKSSPIPLRMLKGLRPMSRGESPGKLSETLNAYKLNGKSPKPLRTAHVNNAATYENDAGTSVAGGIYRQGNPHYDGAMYPPSLTYRQAGGYENGTIYENEEDYEDEGEGEDEEEEEGEEEYEGEVSPERLEQVEEEEEPSHYSRWDYQFCSQTPSELTEQAYQLQISVVQSKHRGKGAYRKSYSFTNARFREIERTNRILVQKILIHKELARKRAKKLKNDGLRKSEGTTKGNMSRKCGNEAAYSGNKY